MTKAKKWLAVASRAILLIGTRAVIFAQPIDTTRSSPVSFPNESIRWTMLAIAVILLGGFVMLLNVKRRRFDKEAGLR